MAQSTILSAMTQKRFIAILCITGTATVAWFVLGQMLNVRTSNATAQMGEEVQQVWGPVLSQSHVRFSKDSVAAPFAVLPQSSHVEVKLHFDPKKRGLLWHRTYDVDFAAEYLATNPDPEPRRIWAEFHLPSPKTSYDHFVFQWGDDKDREIIPNGEQVQASTIVPPGGTATLKVGYVSRGMNSWAYAFTPGSRVKDFSMKVHTDFTAFSIPVASVSPTERHLTGDGRGMDLEWKYQDVLQARPLAVEMPALLNAGPVVARITIFAPVSLVLFFAVLLIFGLLRGHNLHPMVYAFLAAGFFSFHLLLAYLADLVPLEVAFAVAAVLSVLLVCGYLHTTAGRSLSLVALIAQISYMVLFSYSFFFDGLTGLSLTITGIATLALLMMLTARLDWEKVWQGGATEGWRKATTS